MSPSSDPPENTPTVRHVRVRCDRWFGSGTVLSFDDAGKGYLVRNADVGEEVVAEVHTGRWVTSAAVVEVLTPSPRRVVPGCERADRCTGCALLHLSPQAEVDYKRLVISEVLQRVAGLQVAPGEIESIGDLGREAWRTRARYTARLGPRGIVFGLRDTWGELLDLPGCPANDPELERTLTLARNAVLPALFELGSGAEWRLLVDRTERGWVIEVEGADLKDGRLAPRLLAAALEEPLQRALRERRSSDNEPAGVEVRLVGRAEPLTVPAEAGRANDGPDGDGANATRIRPASFWRPARADVFQTLYHRPELLDAVDGLRVLDATCGSGTLAGVLRTRARSVLGVDANWDAVCAATARAEREGWDNATFRGGTIQTVAERLADAGETFDVVVLNPMRRSLGEACMRDLRRLRPRRLIYLSPAPQAAAFDLVAWGLRREDLRWVASVNSLPGTAGVFMALVAELAQGPGVEPEPRVPQGPRRAQPLA